MKRSAFATPVSLTQTLVHHHHSTANNHHDTPLNTLLHDLPIPQQQTHFTACTLADIDRLKASMTARKLLDMGKHPAHVTHSPTGE